jgi:hypothetical protein
MWFFCKESFGKEYGEYNILLSGKIFTFAHVSKMFCGENKETKKKLNSPFQNTNSII